MLILIVIAIGIIFSVSAMKYINLYGYPSLPQILLFTAIAIGILLSLLYIFFLLFFSQLDPMRFRLTKQCSHCVFAFANDTDFSGGEFEGSNLSNSNISGANFRNANLKKANLSGTSNTQGNPDFQGANLRESNFSDAGLRNIILANAQLQNANLQNAYLPNADLSGTNLQNANLFGAILTNAKTVNTDFTDADLRNAKMCFLSSNQIKLDGAKLEGARITILEGNPDFTPAQKQMLKQRGAILGGPSELCYDR